MKNLHKSIKKNFGRIGTKGTKMIYEHANTVIEDKEESRDTFSSSLNDENLQTLDRLNNNSIKI